MNGLALLTIITFCNVDSNKFYTQSCTDKVYRCFEKQIGASNPSEMFGYNKLNWCFGEFTAGKLQ